MIFIQIHYNTTPSEKSVTIGNTKAYENWTNSGQCCLLKKTDTVHTHLTIPSYSCPIIEQPLLQPSTKQTNTLEITPQLPKVSCKVHVCRAPTSSTWPVCPGSLSSPTWLIDCQQLTLAHKGRVYLADGCNWTVGYIQRLPPNTLSCFTVAFSLWSVVIFFFSFGSSWPAAALTACTPCSN